MSTFEIVNQLQYKNYVPPITDYNVGRRMFRDGITFESCTTDDMRSGWLAAENNAAWSEMNAGGWRAADALLAVTR